MGGNGTGCSEKVRYIFFYKLCPFSICELLLPRRDNNTGEKSNDALNKLKIDQNNPLNNYCPRTCSFVSSSVIKTNLPVMPYQFNSTSSLIAEKTFIGSLNCGYFFSIFAEN